MKRIIVTGGFGFIGSHVIEELLNRTDVEIIANIDNLQIGSDLDNLLKDSRISNLLKPKDSRLQNFVADIANKKVMESIVEKVKPTHIIHLAAESHVDRSITGPINFITTNVLGTTVLLEALRLIAPTAKFVHVSTDEVYGHLESRDAEPFTEKTPLDPRSPYSSSKASSDLIALSYKSTYGLNITVTRCCNNYGERQFDEKFIPTILKHIVDKKQIPVYGTGENVREWIYVKDHAKALIEVLFGDKPEDVYNIFGTERLSNLQLINVITDIVEDVYPMYKQQNYIKFVEDRKGHDFCYMIGTIHDNEIDALYSQQDFYASLEKVVRFYADKFTSQKYKTNSYTIV